MGLTPAELRARGDATPDQRAELRRLLETKRYPLEWRDQLFLDIESDGGLTQVRVKSVLHWLREQRDITDAEPAHATAEQTARIGALLRERIAAGTLTFDEAALRLIDLERMPKRVFVLDEAAVPRTDTPDGYFSLTGSDDRVRSYRVHTPRGSGRQVVDLIIGDLAGQRRRIRGHLAGQVVRAIAADTEAAARLYGETRKRCSDCNQPLRNADQPGFAHGYGPDCWAKRLAAAAIATTDPAPDAE